jgi:transketolase
MSSEELAWRIRRHALDMAHRARSSHIGGSLSVADIIAVLYGRVANVDPARPRMPERDRVILSKGHCGSALYAALAELGFFPVEELQEYGRDGCRFSCHISHEGVPGVEMTTGSLGHGVGVACGMALSARMRGLGHKVYAILGDGECNEGSVWEAAMLASHRKLDNLTVVVDRNGMQAMGRCEDVLDMEPLGEKWRAFGWHVSLVGDGSDHGALESALREGSGGSPKAVIASTVKGKGVSFMEGSLIWHYRDPQGDDYRLAKLELEASRP